MHGPLAEDDVGSHWKWYMRLLLMQVKFWLDLGRFEDLHRFTNFQSYRNLEAGDTQSVKFEWDSNQDSNLGPLAPQAKSLTIRPPLPPLSLMQVQHTRVWPLNYVESKVGDAWTLS